MPTENRSSNTEQMVPAAPGALAESIADVEAWLADSSDPGSVSIVQRESIDLVLYELKRLRLPSIEQRPEDAQALTEQHAAFIGLDEDLMMSQAADLQDAAYALGLKRGRSLAVAQHQGEAEGYPPCDYCGLTPSYHPWHGSGLLEGVENRHIHACNKCRGKLPTHQVEPVASIPDGYCLMPRRLTAENGAKALLLGEFMLQVTRECPECQELEEPLEGCDVCDGEGEYAQRHTIPWDQIKFIYSEAVKGLALQPNTTL